MASRKSSAGERWGVGPGVKEGVVGSTTKKMEGRNVIGRFFLMLLFSGGFYARLCDGAAIVDAQVQRSERHGNDYCCREGELPRRRTRGPVAHPEIPTRQPMSPRPPSSEWEFIAWRKNCSKQSFEAAARESSSTQPKTIATSAKSVRRPPASTAAAARRFPRGTLLDERVALRTSLTPCPSPMNSQKKFPAFVQSSQATSIPRGRWSYADESHANCKKKHGD